MYILNSTWIGRVRHIILRQSLMSRSYYLHTICPQNIKTVQTNSDVDICTIYSEDSCNMNSKFSVQGVCLQESTDKDGENSQTLFGTILFLK